MWSSALSSPIPNSVRPDHKTIRGLRGLAEGGEQEAESAARNCQRTEVRNEDSISEAFVEI